MIKPKQLLTYSALNTFRNCPRKYKHRYVDALRPREKAHALAFGSVIHDALECWYLSVDQPDRLQLVLDHINGQFPQRAGDPQQKATWQLARAMFTGYVEAYPEEDFEVLEIEKEFVSPIHNPDSGDAHREYQIAGKADGIVRCHDGVYLLEHKTASAIDGNYLDKLWTDTQIALYCHYLRQQGFPIIGVIYNVLLKSRLKQGRGETEQEYEIRRAELAVKNKSGKSNAKRQMPESDEAYGTRLTQWYARPDAFHREYVYLTEDRLQLVQEEVWELTRQRIDAQARDKWLLNTSNCFQFQRPCEYLPYCQSGFNPNVAENLYEISAPHEELSQNINTSTPSF